MEIRAARGDDWGQIWPFFARIVAAGETYAYDRDTQEDEARRIWMVRPPGAVAVAVDSGAVIGSASMYRNRGGGGSHVASASFMVDPDHAGKGAGRALGASRAFARRSSTRSWRPTTGPWRCGARSGSSRSRPCPRHSNIHATGA